MKTNDIARLVRSLAGPFAFAGVAVARGGKTGEVFCAAADGIKAGPETLFRAASISKVVTGQVLACAAAQHGIGHPYHVDVSDILGWPLRHPRHAEMPITLAMVAAHFAGLSDEGGYLIPPDRSLEDWFEQETVWAAKPGTTFAYSNLGYVVLAACAEALTGRRFGDLASEFLDELGVAGGFNWWGVAERDNRVATYRREPAGLAPQLDAIVAPKGLSLPDGSELSLAGYKPAINPSPFSPQGGLRLSMAGALRLAQALPRFDARALWSPDMGVTTGPDGVFEGYGMGLQLFDRPSFYPRPLVGHFANAYGFVGGIWWDREADLAFAYGLNGQPPSADGGGGDDDDIAPEELAIFDAVTAAAR